MARKPAKKIGRPTKRTDAVIQRIIEGLTAGTPLTVICKPDDMPGVTTVYDWMSGDAALSEAIARARDMGWDAIAVEALEIMDASPERVITTVGEDRSESRIDSAAVQWAARRADLRLKLLAKWDPKRYGDRQLLGSDPENPLPTGFAVKLVKSDSADA
jgi:hypothetical protein